MKRLIPGLMLAAGWLFLLLSGSYSLFWFVVFVLAMLGAQEYLRMVVQHDLRSIVRLMLAISIALPVVLTGLWHEVGLTGGLFLSFCLLLCYILTNYSQLSQSLEVLNRLVFGLIYIGFLSAHLLLIWNLPEGNLWLIILVAITAGADSGAYYSGKTFGKHKLCRNISPNKTIEGAVGGIISGIAVSIIFALILLDSVNWLVLVPVAILLTIASIIGDLCESLVKRGTDTKDSGTLLLGHGGILDRVDSLLLAAPLLYYILVTTG